MGVMADQVLAKTPAAIDVRDFGAWMSAEQKRICLLCNRLLQDRDEADSATQDTFLKAYQALKRIDTPDDPARWVTRIAVNTCLDRLRSRKWQFWRRRPSPEDEQAILAGTASGTPNAEQQILAGQIGIRLASAMERLSARQRAVFTLRHYDNCSLEEIAQVLDLEVGTVKAHMFRAISKLREELRDLYGMKKERP